MRFLNSSYKATCTTEDYIYVEVDATYDTCNSRVVRLRLRKEKSEYQTEFHFEHYKYDEWAACIDGIINHPDEVFEIQKFREMLSNVSL